MRARLRVLLRISVSRRAVVHLLRPVRNVGLLHKRSLARVFQIHQRRYGGPALCLRFQGQPQKRLEVLLIVLRLGSACQTGESGLQRRGLDNQQDLQRVQVTALDLGNGVAQLVNQLFYINICAHDAALMGLDHRRAVERCSSPSA